MKNFSGLFLVTALLLNVQTMFAQVKSATTNEYEEFDDPTKALKLQSDKDAVNKVLEKGSWWRKSMANSKERMRWYDDARFGMFVHWGVYSLAGGEWEGKPVGGYAEQILRTKKIPQDVYRKELIDKFNPLKFNADEWMKAAKDAGMKYMIITAKHHDGFAMWPSDAYPYDIRLTPFKRDPMRELRDAAKKHGIKFGFYYSHANDWEHIDASGRDWDVSGKYVQALTKGTTDWNNYPQYISRLAKYVDEKAIPQLKELAKYNPDIFWFDTNQHLPISENLRILENLRQVAPDVVVNGRLVTFGEMNFGDYFNTTDKPAFFRPQNQSWEGLPTTNESYGYSKFDMRMKPASHFIGLLAGAASKGGNILMNIGPMGNGAIDERDKTILKGVGDWMKINGEAIYGTKASPLATQIWGETTKKGNTYYLLVKQWPKDGKLALGGYRGAIEKAYLLSDKAQKPLQTTQLNNQDLIITVPKKAPDTSYSVIVLKAKIQPQIDKQILLSAKNGTNTLQVFDADTIGQGFSYGGGKLHQQFVKNWKSKGQSLQWKTRLNEPAKFNITLSYNTASENESGKVFVIIANQKFPVAYQPTTSKQRVEMTLQVGTIQLPAGKHLIKLEGDSFAGKQFLQPLNITLKPID
ncbi:alpha-L-fucosidase [Pedobacter frigiditerrae]|uniref:alpha-L-fucosidase n=1 Tax=Pedobacter frigiditerrae TaxID=2530452 RepID=A0A4R0MQQ3_9SPHI|nr:alpha-L-fucosidase [Pedobacter frigiditerrae]TCC88602.1 alpha-L-fucosidase [Pedobacter frigiditerrae]